MKNIFLAAIGFCLSLAGAAQAQSALSQNQSQVLSAPFQEAYVPKGFDANDRVQITVEGSFADSCYRVDNPEVKVDEDAKTISIQAKGHKINGYCFVYPGIFVQTIDVGHLDGGEYQIVSQDGSRTYDSLTVAEAKIESQDDFPYAPVTQAYVQNVDGHNRIFLSGTFTSSCQELQTVKVIPQEKVIVVQPIMRFKTEACNEESIPFETSVAVSDSVKGHFLLHVRSTAGQAINTMVNLN